MTDSKPKSSTAAKPPAENKKPGLEIKPVKDLEPDEETTDQVRGGVPGPGIRFSDATLKSDVASIVGALGKLRSLRP